MKWYHSLCNKLIWQNEQWSVMKTIELLSLGGNKVDAFLMMLLVKKNRWNTIEYFEVKSCPIFL